MRVCAKCGKEKVFQEDDVVFKNAVIVGIFPEYLGRHVCMSCQHELLDSKAIPYRGFDVHHRSEERIREIYLQVKGGKTVSSTPLKERNESEIEK